MRSFIRRSRLVFEISALLSAAVLIGRPANGQEATKKEPEYCFLWKVSSKSATIYLLGSMHLVRPDMYPLPPEIEDAFAISKKLVVEVNMEGISQAKLLQLTLTKGMYPPGETLSKNLSKQTLELLAQYCAKNKTLKVANLEPMRPWLATMLLAVEQIKAAGYSDEGIDKHFLMKAKAQKKPIMELETAEFQLELLSGMATDLQDKMLAQTITDGGEMKSTMEKIIASWKAGDAKAVNDMMILDTIKRHPESKPVMVKMFDDRNVTMADKIEGLLQRTDTCCVVVGAGHLVGDKGLVKLLEAKKYTVEQVRRAPAKKKAA